MHSKHLEISKRLQQKAKDNEDIFLSDQTSQKKLEKFIFSYELANGHIKDLNQSDMFISTLKERAEFLVSQKITDPTIIKEVTNLFNHLHTIDYINLPSNHNFNVLEAILEIETPNLVKLDKEKFSTELIKHFYLTLSQPLKDLIPGDRYNVTTEDFENYLSYAESTPIESASHSTYSSSSSNPSFNSEFPLVEASMSRSSTPSSGTSTSLSTPPSSENSSNYGTTPIQIPSLWSNPSSSSSAPSTPTTPRSHTPSTPTSDSRRKWRLSRLFSRGETPAQASSSPNILSSSSSIPSAAPTTPRSSSAAALEFIETGGTRPTSFVELVSTPDRSQNTSPRSAPNSPGRPDTPTSPRRRDWRRSMGLSGSSITFSPTSSPRAQRNLSITSQIEEAPSVSFSEDVRRSPRSSPCLSPGRK